MTDKETNQMTYAAYDIPGYYLRLWNLLIKSRESVYFRDLTSKTPCVGCGACEESNRKVTYRAFKYYPEKKTEVVCSNCAYPVPSEFHDKRYASLETNRP